MIERAVHAGVPFSWVAGDEVYGGNPGLRRWLEDNTISYVMAVACDEMITVPAGRIRADKLAAKVPREAWQRLSCADGSKGPRLYDWALVDTARADHRLLVRRSLRPGEKGELELACFLCYSPRGALLAEIVAVAGARWAVEDCFAEAGNERPGPLPGPQVPRLVPAHHLVHARPRVPRRHRPRRPDRSGACGTGACLRER